jgi:trk system potassium uptake protein TrkA
VKSTIARVRNPEYSREMSLVQEDLGLSLAINPELTAAQEMARLVRFPAAIKIDSFAKGRVEIFKLMVNEKSPLAGLRIRDISSEVHFHVLVCVVERGSEVFIPTGDFVIEQGDRISVVAPHKQTAKFFKWAGALGGRINNMMIVGGGKIAYYLADRLLDDGIKVKIVEQDHARCEELSELLPKASVLHGSHSDHQLLLEEGLESTDAIASLTEYDEDNVLLSLYAAAKSKAKIITKVNSSSLNEIVSEMPVDSLISPRLITAERILRYVRAMQNTVGSNVETLYKMADNRVEALEFRVRTNMSLLGTPLMDLRLKKNLLIACINRKGKIIIPGGQDTIEMGDTVIVVTTNTGLSDLSDIMES